MKDICQIHYDLANVELTWLLFKLVAFAATCIISSVFLCPRLQIKRGCTSWTEKDNYNSPRLNIISVDLPSCTLPGRRLVCLPVKPVWFIHFNHFDRHLVEMQLTRISFSFYWFFLFLQTLRGFTWHWDGTRAIESLIQLILFSCQFLLLFPPSLSPFLSPPMSVR